jgi:hypothetical protein
MKKYLQRKKQLTKYKKWNFNFDLRKGNSNANRERTLAGES